VLVDSLSFEVSTGEPVILIGETGSGKSLIAQAILGNITNELEITGKIWIQGTEYLSRKKTDRQKLWGRILGLLPQEPWLSLNPTKRTLSQLSEVYQLVRHATKTSAHRTAREDLRKLAQKETITK
jgi:peptide/nickel transport system ATP-binding protein